MSRPFGGNSPLGSEINSISSAQHAGHIQRKRTKYGRIKDVLGRKTNQAEYIVILQMMDENMKSQGLTGPLKLDADSLSLAMEGEPTELIGKWCRVEFDGPSKNIGNAYLSGDPSSRNREAATKANQVEVQGAAFAPPGSGMF